MDEISYVKECFFISIYFSDNSGVLRRFLPTCDMHVYFWVWLMNLIKLCVVIVAHIIQEYKSQMMDYLMERTELQIINMEKKLEEKLKNLQPQCTLHTSVTHHQKHLYRMKQPLDIHN